MFSKYLCFVCLKTHKGKVSQLWSQGLFQPLVQSVQGEEQLLLNYDTSPGDPQFGSEGGQGWGCSLYLSMRKHLSVEIRNTRNTSDLACLLAGTTKNQELEARLGLCCALPEELQDQPDLLLLLKRLLPERVTDLRGSCSLKIAAS